MPIRRQACGHPKGAIMRSSGFYTKRKPMVALILAVGIALSAGCGDLPPSHQRQVEMRERGFEKGVRNFESPEEGRLDKMGHTLNHLEDQHQEDIANTQQNAGRLEKWIQDDFDNWNRSLPKHEQRFHDLMKGRPESAERVLPLILY
jgi:hypothetical protein